MDILFYNAEQRKNFFEKDIPSLIQAIKQEAHELQQNTKMHYKPYESMLQQDIICVDDMTIEQFMGILHKLPRTGKVHVLGINKFYIIRDGSDISFDDQPFIKAFL